MKNKIKIVSILAIIIAIGLTSIYFAFFRIDTSELSYDFLLRNIPSPNEQYLLKLKLLKEEERSDKGYIYGRLYESMADENGDIFYVYKRDLYWDLIDIDQSNEDATDIERWSKSDWIDNQTIIIEGLEIDVNNGSYDYRRHKRHNSSENQY